MVSVGRVNSHVQSKKLQKLLAFFNLMQLVALTIAVAWIGKTYLIDLPNYRIYVTSLFESNLWVGQPFPIISFHTTGNAIHTDFREKKGGLVLLFDQSSCQPCLELVLGSLQHVHNRIEDPDQFPVYAITYTASPSTESQFLRAFGIKYKLGTLLIDEYRAYSDLFSRTPVVFLIDSHQTIIQCHYPLYDKEQFTQLFFWKLISINLPALEVNTDGFADSPLKKLEGLSVLDVIRGHHTLKGI